MGWVNLMLYVDVVALQRRECQELGAQRRGMHGAARIAASLAAAIEEVQLGPTDRLCSGVSGGEDCLLFCAFSC